MTLCIVIPVFNRKEVTLKCLEQIVNQTVKGVEVVIVDDGSKDGTSNAIKLFYPTVHVVTGTGDWWYTKSINEGLKFAKKHLKPSHYLLLNDDVVLGKNYIDTVLEVLAVERGKPGVYGSVSFDSAGTGKPTYLGVKKLVHWRNKQYHYTMTDYEAAVNSHKLSWPSPFVPGRGMFFSAKTLSELGMLNETFVQYGSDYEFSARAKARGYRSEVVIDAVLYSHENLTGSGSPKNRPTFKKFIHSLFNKYSPTYPLNDSRLIWIYGEKVLMPISFLFILAGKFKAYFKYR